MALGSENGIGEVLRSLPRQDPPAVALETILDRWQRQRRARLLGAGFAVAAGLLAVFLLPTSGAKAPVHLRIRVIEAPQESELPDVPSAFALAPAPEELQAP